MNAVSIHKRNWFFAASCVLLVSVNTPPAGAQVECCEQSAGPTTALLPTDHEYLGWSVAVDGSTAFAGAKDFDFDFPDVTLSGRVLVFDFVLGSWDEVADLRAPDEAAGDQFGVSVALDGDFAVIGAHRNDIGSNNSGSAYIFERDGGIWDDVTILTADDAAANDAFGWSVAIQGDLAVIGALQGDQGILIDVGAVYIFDRNYPTPDAWGQVQKLNASDAASNDSFGHSVSIDGDLIVVGAPREDDQPNDAAGAAYIFRFNDPDWDEERILTASDADALDNFGTSVSVAGDRAVIGAPYRDLEVSFDNKGGAYVYRFDDPSWVEEQILTACETEDEDNLGMSVSMYEKPANAGFVVVTGAPQNEGTPGPGRADVFGYLGAGWARLHQLTASDAEVGDDFGTAVSIKGGTAVVGALGWDDDANDEGAIYVFDGLDNEPSCVCPWDLDGNGDVGVSDLLALLAAWGPCPAPPAGCPADFDGNGDVGVSDLLALLANWSDCMDEAIPLEDAQDCMDKFYPDDMDALIACIEAFGG